MENKTRKRETHTHRHTHNPTKEGKTVEEEEEENNKKQQKLWFIKITSEVNNKIIKD